MIRFFREVIWEGDTEEEESWERWPRAQMEVALGMTEHVSREGMRISLRMVENRWACSVGGW